MSSTPTSPHFFHRRCHRASRSTYLREMCDSACFSAGPELPYFRWGCFRPTASGCSCGAKNGDRLWQTFILPCPFVSFLQQQKEASTRALQFWGWRCNANPFLEFASERFSWMCTRPKNLPLCPAPHYYNCFSLDISCLNSRMDFPCGKNQDPRYPSSEKSTDP